MASKPVLTDEEVARRLDPSTLIDALETAFRRNYRQTVRMPARLQMDIPPVGTFLLMPCYDTESRTLGIKYVTVHDRPVPGRNTVEATYELLDPETQEVRLRMAANDLTDLRTAAVSAVATRHLANPEGTALGILGTGRQARAHLGMLPLVQTFEKAFICGSSPERSDRFIEEMSPACPFPLEPAGPQSLVEQSDIICTCTTAAGPLFDGGWLRPGTHLNLVGAFQPAAREVDTETIRRARVFVDTYEGAWAEAGDILIPWNENAIAREHVRGDLHELLSGATPGRTAERDITVFESLGCALEDLVAATLVQENLKEGRQAR